MKNIFGYIEEYFWFIKNNSSADFFRGVRRAPIPNSVQEILLVVLRGPDRMWGTKHGSAAFTGSAEYTELSL